MQTNGFGNLNLLLPRAPDISYGRINFLTKNTKVLTRKVGVICHVDNGEDAKFSCCFRLAMGDQAGVEL